MATREWKAYPKFAPPENTATQFRMGANSYGGESDNKSLHRVYNTSVLEGSVAAMEVSAISGRNVALLLEHDFSQSKEGCDK